MRNVVADTPLFCQGETLENPSPAPNARSTRVTAADDNPPAMIAAQETADTAESSVPGDSLRTIASAIAVLPRSAAKPPHWNLRIAGGFLFSTGILIRLPG